VSLIHTVHPPVQPGNVYGYLTVIEFAGSRRTNAGVSERTWACKCACGADFIAVGAYLREGATKSCGCYRREVSRAKLSPPTTTCILGPLKRSAKKRGIAWDLSDDEALDLVAGDCVYCGAGPRPYKHPYKTVLRNGIDRKDPSKGYSAENCATACAPCNTAKMAMTVDEFDAFITRVYNFRNRS